MSPTGCKRTYLHNYLMVAVCLSDNIVEHVNEVTVGFWTVTRPTLPAAYQMSVQSVEWHHTP